MTPKSEAVRQSQRTRAVAALLSCPTIESAASATGISSRTLQRYLSDPAFQSMLHDAAQSLLEHTARHLVGLSACAASTLDQVMSDPVTPAGVRARASDLILSNALKMQETVTLAQRVRKLEDTARGLSPCPNV
jgi:hypothetical protein